MNPYIFSYYKFYFHCKIILFDELTLHRNWIHYADAPRFWDYLWGRGISPITDINGVSLFRNIIRFVQKYKVDNV